MIVSAIQFRPRFSTCSADVSDNFRRAFPLIAQAARLGSDLAVLPELCFTGASFLGREQAAAVAEPAAGRTFAAVRAAAAEAEMYVAYGFVEEDSGNLFNSAAVVSPAGELVTVSRKANFAGCDHMWASRAASLPDVVPTPFGLLAAVVCKDLKDEAPEGAGDPVCPMCDVPSGYYQSYPCPCCGHRKRAGQALPPDQGVLQGRRVDVVAGLTNWGRGMFPASTWVDFARSNSCVLVVANRWGEEENSGPHGCFITDFHQGGSAVVMPDGEVRIPGLKFMQDCVVTTMVEET